MNSFSDRRFKCEAFSLLAFGVLPFEQWGSVFSNPSFLHWPGLCCKAFTVWFPTMIDYLKTKTQLEAYNTEISHRQINCSKLFNLIDELNEKYSRILSLYSRDEQLFIRDRRLQNVHGKLSQYSRNEISADCFEPETNTVQKSALSADEHRQIMAKFYPAMQKNELELLKRFLQSPFFSDLDKLYSSRLRVNEFLMPLAEELGITTP